MQKTHKLLLVAGSLIAVGLAGTPILFDPLSSEAKVGIGTAFLLMLLAGCVLWLRAAAKPAAHDPGPEAPTRQPLIDALRQYGDSLDAMLDSRAAESPGPKGGIRDLLTKHRAELEASAPARARHDARTLALYFEKFRTVGLRLFDEAVNGWWAGNPKRRPLVANPKSVSDLRSIVSVFRDLVRHLEDKEVDRAMEARGYVKQYVPVDPRKAAQRG
jgi:hypothetical protein